ncbi:MAG: IS66 family transposase [Verrucomicrobiae bacterium]|nr:IS66 family transposase [Verrucomicrobiae bacterium]
MSDSGTILQEEITYLQEQISELTKVIETKEQTIRAQQKHLNELLKRIYGRRSEKLNPDQLVFNEMILGAEENTYPQNKPIDNAVKEKIIREHIRRSHPGRRPLPEHLKRIEHYLDIDEKEKFTADGKERPVIGHDITEKLDYQPCSLIVHRYIRPKYGADDDIDGSGVKQASMPDGPIDKCLAEPGLLAHIIVEKHEHHTPLYRQEVKFDRLGVSISRKTMSGWMYGCAQSLKPLYDYMREIMLRHDIALNDDTPVKVLDPGSGKTHRGFMWCTVGGEDLKYTFYNFTMSRSREGPSEFFKGYTGFLMTDDYAGYNQVIQTESIMPLTCWAHVRRYFKIAQESHPKKATEILVLIAQLYDIEKKAKYVSAQERFEIRQKKSRRQLAKIMLWLRAHRNCFLPKSPLALAIHHALKLRRKLTRYTVDGRLPIDNNLTENGIRPIALGRKNWLFIGSEAGGETAAILLTFCATCRNLKINTWEYLTDVLSRINTHPMSRIDELLPDRWQDLRQAASHSVAQS